MTFQKKFVVLTAWWSMRTGGSGMKFHEFDSMGVAQEWAIERHKKEDDVKGIIEMLVPSSTS